MVVWKFIIETFFQYSYVQICLFFSVFHVNLRHTSLFIQSDRLPCESSSSLIITLGLNTFSV